jgi:SLBB domain-containing protein
MKTGWSCLIILVLTASASTDRAQSRTEKPVVFIYGEVHKEGEHPFTDGLTVRKAIILARGITRDADLLRVYLFHEHPSEKERDGIRLNLSGILSGGAADIALRPNDIIIIPDRKNSEDDSKGGWWPRATAVLGFPIHADKLGKTLRSSKQLYISRGLPTSLRFTADEPDTPISL